MKLLSMRVSAAAAAIGAAVCLCVSSVLPAQRLGPAPKRPKVPATLDTNDAAAYHEYAMQVFDRDPDAAASAFYWAARIDPTNASALYGRRTALLVRSSPLLKTLMAGGRRRFESKDLRALDSLQLRALMIDPFLYTRLDKQMFKAFIVAIDGGDTSPSELDFAIESYLRQASSALRAWVSYNDGAFAKAVDQYRDAIKSVKEKADLRIERGRTFALIQQPDSAITEFNLALEELRKRDKKDLVLLYNSKAVLEHSIGALLERTGSKTAAREAYGRALQEDLSYYPAHLRLGILAIDAGDTTTALSELELAAQIAADDPHVHFVYGFALANFGKSSEAIAALTKSAELEPFYARPHAILGELLEKSGDKAGAIKAYDRFLVLASRNDGDRRGVTARRAALDKSVEYGTAQHSAVPYTAPRNGASRNGASRNGAPRNGAPRNGAPRNGAPQYDATRYGAPRTMEQ